MTTPTLSPAPPGTDSSPGVAPTGAHPTDASDDVPRIVRAGIAAAASHDVTAIARALHEVTHEQTADEVVGVVAAVIGTVLLHVHRRLPDDAQILAVAAQIASTQAWAGVTAPQIARLLHGVVRAQPLRDGVTRAGEYLLFVCAAHLLTAYHDVIAQAWRHQDPVAATVPRRPTAGATS